MGRITAASILTCLLLAGCTPAPHDLQENIPIKGGSVQMFGQPGFETPIPDLEVQASEVTNHEFRKFTEATGYITTAEKRGESMVFDLVKKQWALKKGADWKHPQGLGSGIGNKMDHPVVQVSYDDACAYCEWLDMRLPYESEWEYIFALDAEKPAPNNNHWEGIFPYHDSGADGYTGTSPAGHYGKGGSGCYDLGGNVWEWCQDYYHEQWPFSGLQFPGSARYKGPAFSFSETAMYDTTRVIKGGSFLCADNYCRGYTNQTRMGADPHTGYEHTGFRCVRNKP